VLKSYTKYVIGGLLLILVNTAINAQILKDTANFNLLKRGVNYIYSLQFDKAGEVYEKMKSAYPDHPIPYLFKGMMTYWKNYPLIPSSSAAPSFEEDLYKCIELCEKGKNIADEAEYLLANIGARGLLLLYYADNNLSMDVVSVASRTYQLVMRSFEYTKTYFDFYFVTGLYNYYREAYPEAHPVYKPFAILFPKGDKSKGLKELQMAAKYAVFLKGEAFTFLTGIYISFENNFPAALSYSRSLHEQYPQNPTFRSAYVKNLLLLKRYNEAESVLEQNKNSKNTFIQTQYYILKGIITEKKYKDLLLAESFYKAGIKTAGPVGEFADEYVAYAYFGISRIMKIRGEIRLSKSYHKKAMDLSAFKNVNFDD
jgi:hypothetical protein